jgi:hypothetical protein
LPRKALTLHPNKGIPFAQTGSHRWTSIIYGDNHALPVARRCPQAGPWRFLNESQRPDQNPKPDPRRKQLSG